MTRSERIAYPTQRFQDQSRLFAVLSVQTVAGKSKTLATGGRIEIGGHVCLGSLDRATRSGRDPGTGDSAEVQEWHIPLLKPVGKTHQRVNITSFKAKHGCFTPTTDRSRLQLHD